MQGILPDGLVTVVDATWYGSAALEFTRKDGAGQVGTEIVSRSWEPAHAIVIVGRPWSFNGVSALRRVVSEDHRISLADLFNLTLAVRTFSVAPF